MIPGEIITKDRDIELNQGKETRKVTVSNRGDRAVQVGSHFHFFEVNRLLDFDRASGFGARLNIPSGTSVRFEPGESKEVELVEIIGRERVYGLNNLTQGSLGTDNCKIALKRAIDQEFFSKEGE